jgi:hypothetical protein
MKKYVWLLAIAAFVVAVLAMVGCKPAETPTASPTPTAPTPTPDTKCPAIVGVVVKNVYGDVYREGYTDGKYFTVTLTFDEDIAGDWACLRDPNNWTVTVVNAAREDDAFHGDGKQAVDYRVQKVSAKQIKITAMIYEGSNPSLGGTAGSYAGLICDEEDADIYKSVFNLYDRPAFADTVKVKLDPDCVVYDALGNPCCGLEAEGCCAVTCEVTIPTGCQL